MNFEKSDTSVIQISFLVLNNWVSRENFLAASTCQFCFLRAACLSFLRFGVRGRHPEFKVFPFNRNFRVERK